MKVDTEILFIGLFLKIKTLIFQCVILNCICFTGLLQDLPLLIICSSQYMVLWTKLHMSIFISDLPFTGISYIIVESILLSHLIVAASRSLSCLAALSIPAHSAADATVIQHNMYGLSGVSQK